MKKQKGFIWIAVFFSLYSASVAAQQNLKLYATFGTQVNTFNSRLETGVSPTIYSFSLGAGSTFSIKRFLLGTEFYFSNGRNTNAQSKLDYSARNSTVFIGYKVNQGESFQIEPGVGISFLHNKAIVSNKTTFATRYYTANNIGLTPSFSISKSNRAGVFYGLKAGCNFTFNPHARWENGVDFKPTAITDNMGSFFIQFTTGGILNLKKKKSNYYTPNILTMTLPGSNHHTVSNGDDKLYTTIYPNAGKETIVLLHGGPGFPSDLTEIADILKDSFQIISFHQRGTQQSPCKSGHYTMASYLSDIDSVVKYYEVEQFHLWGHSWGGLYAQIYANQNYGNLLSLFLCCPGSGTGAQWKQTEKEVMQLNKSKCTTWQWTKMGWNSMLGALGSDNAYKHLFKQVMKNYNDGFVNSDDLGVDFDNLKSAPINKTRPEIIKYPILTKQEKPGYAITIVYGDQDIYQSSKAFVLDRYPTAMVETLKNCGHLPWLHNPGDYKRVLRAHYCL